MTDNTQPEALRLANVCSNLTRYSMEAHLIAAELRLQHTRIAELEAQLSSSGFTAADMATASAQGFRDGVASVAASAPTPSAHIKEPYTLAEIKAKIASHDYGAELLLQHAMLLLDSASLAASAGSEPEANNRPSLESVFRGISDRAYCNYIEQMRRNECLGWEHKVKHGTFGEAELKAHTQAGRLLGRHHAFAEAANALRGSDASLTHPSPPEGMVGGWQDIATAPKDSGYLLLRGRREQDVASGYWLQSAYDGNGAWIWPLAHISPWFWAPLPPTTPAGSGKGE